MNLPILSIDTSVFWLKMGFTHLLDLNGYDHMLFLWMVFLYFTGKSYRNLLAQLSLFTLAHSLSLALSALQWISVPSLWVERFIALSIAFSAAYSYYTLGKKQTKVWISWMLIFLFGLIHGMGFSGLLLSLLGHDSSIIAPLLYFNVGLELGQILFVAAIAALQISLHRYSIRGFQNYQKGSACIGFLLGISLFITRI